MIVALEGHSYSGKTTLFNNLKNNVSIHPIAEHDMYIDKPPPFPALNEQMAKEDADFFARLEIKRFQDAQLSAQKVILYDRSFISVIFFQKYLKHLSLPSQYDAYEYAKELFLKMLHGGEIALPDYFVFVRCGSLTIYLQRQKREISVNLLRGEKALRFFEEEYDRVFNIYKDHGRALELHTFNTEDSIAENVQQVEAVLSTGGFENKDKEKFIDKLMGVM